MLFRPRRLPMIERSPWWDKAVHADRRPLLMARGRIRDAARSYFAAQGFHRGGVRSPSGLAGERGPPPRLRDRADRDRWRRAARFYLHTSPEFACKKLLAAGERRIFTLAPVYRNRERGDLQRLRIHHAGMVSGGGELRLCHRGYAQHRKARRQGGGQRPPSAFATERADPFAEPERDHGRRSLPRVRGHRSCRDAWPRRHHRSRRARAIRRPPPASKWRPTTPGPTSSAASSSNGSSRASGLDAPTILDEYPRAEAALARATPHDERFAERFELYLCGVELANGFGELTDAAEQRRRFEHEMDEKQRIYGERYPIDEDFLAALAHMPPASGVALGFDRLVMLATHAGRIDRVIWTPRSGVMTMNERVLRSAKELGGRGPDRARSGSRHLMRSRPATPSRSRRICAA